MSGEEEKGKKTKGSRFFDVAELLEHDLMTVLANVVDKDSEESSKLLRVVAEEQRRASPSALFSAIHKRAFEPRGPESPKRLAKVRRLLDDPDVRRNINEVDGKECSALFYAVQLRMLEAARMLVEAGADPLQGGPTKAPLRLLFYGTGGPEGGLALLFIEWLLSRLDREGRREQAIACLSASPNILAKLCFIEDEERLNAVSTLLKYGVEPAALDAAGSLGRGWTTLHSAARFNHIGLTRLLIQHGVDVNATAQDGYRPLHIAAAHGHCDVMLQLLRAGAATQARTDEDRRQPKLDRKTAAELANTGGYPHAAQLISMWERLRGDL